VNWLHCPADQFVLKFLPLFERISHCELILANRQDVDQSVVLARLKVARVEIERLSSKKMQLVEIAEIEEIEIEDLPEVNSNEIALSALIPEPLPKVEYVHAKRPPSGNRWLSRAKAFLQENGPATMASIAIGLGIQTETDKRLLNASLHTAYKKKWIYQAGVVHGKRGRANVIWTISNSAGNNIFS
jgi:hypothetical protein